jgi:hypothetical protein
MELLFQKTMESVTYNFYRAMVNTMRSFPTMSEI